MTTGERWRMDVGSVMEQIRDNVLVAISKGKLKSSSILGNVMPLILMPCLDGSGFWPFGVVGIKVDMSAVLVA
jgi:hypothetical protein